VILNANLGDQLNGVILSPSFQAAIVEELRELGFDIPSSPRLVMKLIDPFMDL
jgi:hypothetical protein